MFVEAFLIIEHPRQRLGHWTKILAPLDDGRAPPISSVTAYYDPTCDQALLGLRYEVDVLGRERLAFVIEIALLAELGMIQPAELSEGDRQRFLGERLARCTGHVCRPRGVVDTLTELVHGVRDGKPRAKGTRDDLEPPPAVIQARFLRSGRWVPVRIAQLSLKGASLMTGALPRLGDHVDLAFVFGEHCALVRGPAQKVSTMEEAALTGAATFSTTFVLDDASRRQLTKLLTAAREAQVTIKPAPARRERRFPVEWAVCLGTMRGAVRAEALDVSRDGMFVKPVHQLSIDTNLNFSTTLDDSGASISGRARVVRQVDDIRALELGIAPGYGLSFVEMSPEDRSRWIAFVKRIERRTERRVLVGAAPARLGELQARLAGAGYAVTGGTDPGALVQLAAAEARPVDAVLIDASWVTPAASLSWIETLFSARNVPCVTTRGDSRRARAAVDELFSIA